MTKSNSSVLPSTSNLYEHPWYSQLKLLDNTMTCESPLQPKLKSVVTGQKSIKKCANCKRWDDASLMYYNTRNCFYRHYQCASIEGRNNRKTKAQLDPSAPKRYVHPVIRKCAC